MCNCESNEFSLKKRNFDKSNFRLIVFPTNQLLGKLSFPTKKNLNGFFFCLKLKNFLHSSWTHRQVVKSNWSFVFNLFENLKLSSTELRFANATVRGIAVHIVAFKLRGVGSTAICPKKPGALNFNTTIKNMINCM